MTILEADGFVADAGSENFIASAAVEAFAPDAAGAGDGKIGDILAPDQAVVPVAVAEVLKLVPGVGLRRIVTAACAGSGRISCNDGRARTEIQLDIALQTNRVAEIRSNRNGNRAATRSGCGINGLVDGVGVESFAVALSAERTD